MLDYYNLLRVAPEASAEAIRAAFRREAKRYHPDANAHLSADEREARQRHFIVLAQAYDTLSDPARRAEYDRRRQAGQGRAAQGAGTTGAGAHRTEEPAFRGGARAHRRGEQAYRDAARAQRGGAQTQRAGAGQGGGAEKGEARKGAAHASDSKRPGSARPEDIPDWGDLLQDVEELLRGFGLNLKQPFEELLDNLMAWALALYREVVGGSAESRTEGEPRAGRPDAGPKPKAPPARDARAGGPRRPDPEAIERELAELKRKAGKPT